MARSGMARFTYHVHIYFLAWPGSGMARSGMARMFVLMSTNVSLRVVLGGDSRTCRPSTTDSPPLSELKRVCVYTYTCALSYYYPISAGTLAMLAYAPELMLM